MTKYVNYLLHTTFDPSFYYRNDSNLITESPKQSLKERIALVALPFLSLYRPFGATISVSLGTYHTISHLADAISAGSEQAWKKCALRTAQMGFAILTIGATFFHLRVGLLLITGADIARNGFAFCLCLYQKQYLQALEKGLELSASAFYLGIMMTGSLEIVLLALLLQAATCLYQAQKECRQGRYPEAVAKMTMGMIRCYQGYQTIEAIQRRNLFLTIQKYKNLAQRIQRGKAVRSLLSHPLIELQKEIQDKRVVLSDAENKEWDFGSHFHGYGKQLVKGENLILQDKVINEQSVMELTFKVNHVFREEIQTLIEELQGMDKKEMAEILQLLGSPISDIKINKESFPLTEEDGLKARCYRITFEGLGSVQIGDSLDNLESLLEDEKTTSLTLPNLHDRVIVRLEATKTLFDLHQLLSMLSLEEGIAVSTPEDQEIHKLRFLFHIFAPREATPFEWKRDFWSLSSEELKATLLEKSPEMKEVLETYLPKMEKYEILPGRMRYKIPGLSEAAYAKGARALVSSITGAYSSEELCDRLASILKMGMISQEMRAFYGINKNGLGGEGIDFLTGGADSIFTQMLTEKNCREQAPLNDFYYTRRNGISLLFPLENLGSGTYQYLDDTYGVRRTDGLFFGNAYLDRLNILEFTDTLQSSSEVMSGNEIMFKERIFPGAVLVENESQKEDLLNGLRMRGVVQLDSNNQETILHIPVERFFRVGKTITEELIAV